MTDKNYPSELVAEAERLTDKLLLQIKLPTPRASIYNRCLESLGWIQEKSWEATDAKWSEICSSNELNTEETIANLRAKLSVTLEALGNLVDQVERSNAVDDHGHEMKQLRALHRARKLIGPEAP